MKNVIDTIKLLTPKHRLLTILAMIALVALLVGCQASGAPPPSGPIGGGCG